MNYTDIIALARAGFTAQQIAQMAQVEPAPVSQQESVQVPQPESMTLPQPETAPIPQPDQLTAILAEMQTLKQTVQAQNRQNAELIPPTPQTAQDILASIIKPPVKDGNK